MHNYNLSENANIFLGCDRGRRNFFIKFQGVERVFCLEIPRWRGHFGLNPRGAEQVFCLEIPKGGKISGGR